MRKKLFALALATTVVLSFAACGSKDASTPNSNSTTPSVGTSTPESSTGASTPESPAEVASATVEDWFAENPSDVKFIEDAMNSQFEGTGFSAKLNAEGNVFIYEYYVEELTEADANNLTEEDLAQLDANFEATVEQQSSNLSTMFESFEEEYGITMEAIRIVFYTSDGVELYSGDIVYE